MALLELLPEALLVTVHPAVELLLRDIHVVYPDVEVLPRREAVTLLAYLVVGDGDREVVHHLLAEERVHYLPNLPVEEAVLLKVALLVLLAQLACVDKHDTVRGGGLVEEDHRDIGASGGEHVARHRHHPIHPPLLHHSLQYAPLHPALGGEEARGHHNGSLARGLEGVEHVLNEAGVDSHLGLRGVGLLHGVRHASPEAPRGGEQVSVLRKVELEGRVGHHEVEALQGTVALLVRRLGEGVALHHVGQRDGKVVEDKVKSQHLRRLLRYVLREDGAALLPYLVGESHKQCASACSGVVASDASKVCVVPHQKARHNLSNGTGRVVLGILASPCVVEVLKQILEDAGEEVVLLREHSLEVEGG